MSIHSLLATLPQAARIHSPLLSSFFPSSPFTTWGDFARRDAIERALQEGASAEVEEERRGDGRGGEEGAAKWGRRKEGREGRSEIKTGVFVVILNTVHCSSTEQGCQMGHSIVIFVYI